MSQTAARIAALLQDMPTPGADPATVAAWFDRKADLLDGIGEQDPTLADDTAQLAANARAHARHLRAGGDL